MKLILVVTCAFLAVAVAAPPESEPAKILRADFDQKPDGSYHIDVETEDGYKREEEGKLVEVNNEEGKPVKVLVVRGSYSYNDPDGNIQSIAYSADQNGFQADGPSVPKNPPPSRR
ncbi:unnamed protein product [Arctia plantaginis]|uniref:Larval cuticle protein 1-like n=1 Tax=Arctia plantaginis TaxID=874455 RepID=A0A8S1AFI4_ARCPL|nr:unnamed protein product [Arctia plantaginis]